MKKLFLIILPLLLCASCAEPFKEINPSEFNAKIALRTDIKSPEDLVLLYFDYPENEAKPELQITTKSLQNDSFEVTLIHTKLEDDSMEGEKIILTAKLSKQQWIVTEIKRNWRCWKDRGHISWGIESCS